MLLTTLDDPVSKVGESVGLSIHHILSRCLRRKPDKRRKLTVDSKTILEGGVFKWHLKRKFSLLVLVFL